MVDSQDLGRYIGQTEGFSKPWLLVQLRLKKLQERKEEMPKEEYLQELADIHDDLMKLGQWWQGIEHEVFQSGGMGDLL
jgi:hypothetical protein